MSLKIKNNSLFTKHYLMVDSAGVVFYETSGIGSARRFRFNQVACVLMSTDNLLSFQVDKEVFSIPTNPDDAVHKTVVAALLQEVRRTAMPAGAP